MAHLHGQGPVGAGGPTSVFHTTPFPHKPGDRAKDNAGNEYMYVDFLGTVYYGTLVQIDTQNRAAPLLGTANRAYRVGVVMGGTPSTVANAHPTSDHGGWVQIYGVHPAVQTGTATDAGVSATVGGAYVCIPQTSVGTPSGVLALQVQAAQVSEDNTSTGANKIFNMWVVDFAEVSDWADYPGTSDTSGPTSQIVYGSGASTSFSGGTSGFIGQVYSVFMNYPYTIGITEPFTDATSDA